jgi:putative spermidine/putrescine transport system permease protein
MLCFFQTFLFSWFEFGLTNMIGVGKVQTLTVRVYGFLQEANPFLAAVSSLLLMIPPFVLLLINRHFVYRKVLRS